ncbi:hypothetical protein KY284_000417 [Solanum tuberosum]|nr:hypothetical protein KY284_000417 [Solanum tuberosum]
MTSVWSAYDVYWVPVVLVRALVASVDQAWSRPIRRRDPVSVVHFWDLYSFYPLLVVSGYGLAYLLVLEDMLRACVMDFGGQWDQFLPLAEFAYNNNYHSKPRSRGTDLLQEALDQVRVIQDRLRTAQSRHQSYADQGRRPLRFSVGDRVFLRVSRMKGVMRFGRRGKLSPRYIGPFEILRTVGEVAYELALPLVFSAIHPVFHVSMLRRYVPDESHVLQYDAVELDDHLTFVEEPVAILARDVRRLRSRAIPVVKVRWRHRPVEKATWETEQEMREQFPGSFEPSAYEP